MTGLTLTELYLRAILADRDREIRALARAARARPARGLRASISAGLIQLALALHREAAARAWVGEAGAAVTTDH